MRERKRDYELMVILNPTRSSDEDVTAIIGRISQVVTAAGGEMTGTTHTPPWGRRKLAYPIREYVEGEATRRSLTEGFYVLIHFRVRSSAIPELERTLKFTENVMRYLLTVPEPVAEPGAAPATVEEGAVEGR